MRPATDARSLARRSLAALGTALLLWNALGFEAARALTHFGPPGPRRRFERSSLTDGAQLLAHGLWLPKPANRRTPAQLGLPCQRIVLRGAHGLAVEGWWIERRPARGTVVLFHGHAGSKSSLLEAARAFRELGFATLLVDFHGSGGSQGNDTSIGWCESEDVAAAADWARRDGSGPLVLYGVSMGSAAILKAVHDGGARPDAIVAECPFDELLVTLRHRFEQRHLPSFPAAETLMFWGGLQSGFNPFHHNPAEYAAAVTAPTLLMFGTDDPWVRPEEGRRIFEQLGGPKRLAMFEGLGHQSYLAARPSEWRGATEGFMRETAGLH